MQLKNYSNINWQEPEIDTNILNNNNNHIEFKNCDNHVKRNDCSTLPTAATTTAFTISACSTSWMYLKRGTNSSKAECATLEVTTIKKTPTISHLSHLLQILYNFVVVVITCPSAIIFLTTTTKLLAAMSSSFNFIYTLQKTKLNLLLLFICCAITVQKTTEAVPVSASTRESIKHSVPIHYHSSNTGHSLILQTPVHRQHSNQLRSNKFLLSEIVAKTVGTHPPSKSHKHRHHIHQRAVNNPKKMSHCTDETSEVRHLLKQMDSSLKKIKIIFKDYLHTREGKTPEEMLKLWNLHDLDIQHPQRSNINMENMQHAKIVTFYLNLHSFHQLIIDVITDVVENKTEIEHGEEYSAESIKEFFEKIKSELHRMTLEAKNFLEKFSIELPNLDQNVVIYNKNMERNTRDFFVVHKIIEEIQDTYAILCPSGE